MTSRFGDQILQVFDVPADAYEFLVGLLDDRAASPSDLKVLFDLSLMAGTDAWFQHVDHAWHLGDNIQPPPFTKASGRPTDSKPEPPWETTDRLIEQAKSLAKEAFDDVLLGSRINESQSRTTVTKAAKRKADATSSHYWCRDGDADDVFSSTKRFKPADLPNSFISRLNIPAPGLQPSCVYPEEPGEAQSSSVHINAGTSPYFPTPTRGPRAVVVPRPSPGTVSCIPFPPLSAESFGIIQEQVAHEPFWLLIVVTFLIKTKGEYAIPTFLRVKGRFPAPCDVANPNNAAELLGMIRHLGLGQNRLGAMQKYAQHFMFDPPRPGVRHAVRRYDAREVGHDLDTQSKLHAENAEDGWEIGHMTQGPYAIDSWRIFCRDVLLGRAKDWNGKGARGEFQPEWMRVLPADKELRAFLRWMWMREGWEWDPATGERTVLREEMRRAAEEGRVRYDIHGELQIVNDQ
ncbi:pre-mRNA splicing factor [Cordyceps javanica]|uniref:Pre-mRNA splicing factor n=1 Tax=Cordyceps javanica TaxID=43265 RepID=A0A545W362_9HYPO|nr:pre-mRNA splicing factor [Cordyceps javanica]TQW08428.1 pre-mRNA splicing factor [Cordyceps javanica]